MSAAAEQESAADRALRKAAKRARKEAAAANEAAAAASAAALISPGDYPSGESESAPETPKARAARKAAKKARRERRATDAAGAGDVPAAPIPDAEADTSKSKRKHKKRANESNASAADDSQPEPVKSKKVKRSTHSESGIDADSAPAAAAPVSVAVAADKHLSALNPPLPRELTISNAGTDGMPAAVWSSEMYPLSRSSLQELLSVAAPPPPPLFVSSIPTAAAGGVGSAASYQYSYHTGRELMRYQAVSDLRERFTQSITKRWPAPFGANKFAHFEKWLLGRRVACPNGFADPILPDHTTTTTGATAVADHKQSAADLSCWDDPILMDKLLTPGAGSFGAALPQKSQIQSALRALGQASTNSCKRIRAVSAGSATFGASRISFKSCDAKAAAHPSAKRSGAAANSLLVEPYVSSGGIHRVRFASGPSVHVEINYVHLRKLWVLFVRTAARARAAAAVAAAGGGGGSDDSKSVDVLPSVDRFAEAVFVLLLRYSSLQGGTARGGGYQAACPPPVFEVLRKEFDCVFECFASPLNTYWGNFCSVFGPPPATTNASGRDECIDAVFGSCGSFFDLCAASSGAANHKTQLFRSGCFEANPPFEPALIERMIEAMNARLKQSVDAK